MLAQLYKKDISLCTSHIPRPCASKEVRGDKENEQAETDEGIENENDAIDGQMELLPFLLASLAPFDAIHLRHHFFGIDGMSGFADVSGFDVTFGNHCIG